MSEEPVAIFKKATKRSSLRSKAPAPTAPTKRPSPSSSEDEGSAIITKKRKLGPTSITASSNTRRLKKTKADTVVDSDDDEGGADIAVKYTSSKDRGFMNPALARSRSPSPSADAKSLVTTENEEKKEEGLYTGTKNAKHQLPTGGGRFGPQKGGPDNVRTITLMDYQPDVCKDYKETGFCGYGDSCKFLHDRGDYLRGWELDNQYLSNPTSTAGMGVRREDTPEVEELPFACLLCRKHFTSPIITRCGHYFCQSCALARFRKTPRCFACGANTGGVFNKAEKVLEAIKIRNEKRGVGGEEEEERELEGIEGLGHEHEEE